MATGPISSEASAFLNKVNPRKACCFQAPLGSCLQRKTAYTQIATTEAAACTNEKSRIAGNLKDPYTALAGLTFGLGSVSLPFAQQQGHIDTNQATQSGSCDPTVSRKREREENDRFAHIIDPTNDVDGTPRKKEASTKHYAVTKTDSDVLLGRGGHSYHHKGNVVYRERILELQPVYKGLTPKEKTQFSRDVVDWMKQRGRRFLKRDGSNSRWYIVADHDARLAVSRALRDNHGSSSGRNTKRVKREPLTVGISLVSSTTRSLRSLLESPDVALDSLCDMVDPAHLTSVELDDDDLQTFDLREDPKIHEDSLLATMLQEEYDEEEAARRRKIQDLEENQMRTTHCGRACLFVEKVLKMLEDYQPSHDTEEAKAKISTVSKDDDMTIFLQQSHESYLQKVGAGVPATSKSIHAVAKDDMVALTQRTMEAQEVFRKAGKPCFVDLGYHYTQTSCMTKIKTDGLMTRKERENQKITVRNNGSAYGDGVYTGNNPFSFRRYGPVGLLVARLQGRSQRVTRPFNGVPLAKGIFDTAIGNKGPSSDYDEVVLLDSSQCLPLVQYSSTLIPQPYSTRIGRFASNNENPMAEIQSKMQQLVNEFFNSGIEQTTHHSS